MKCYVREDSQSEPLSFVLAQRLIPFEIHDLQPWQLRNIVEVTIIGKEHKPVF